MFAKFHCCLFPIIFGKISDTQASVWLILMITLVFSCYPVTSRSSEFSWIHIESLQLAEVFVNKRYLFSINMSPSWPMRVDWMGDLRWLICLFFNPLQGSKKCAEKQKCFKIGSGTIAKSEFLLNLSQAFLWVCVFCHKI